jgi:hypothetical protein
MISEKLDRSMWIELIWLRSGKVVGFFEHGDELFRFSRRRV